MFPLDLHQCNHKHAFNQKRTSEGVYTLGGGKGVGCMCQTAWDSSLVLPLTGCVEPGRGLSFLSYKMGTFLSSQSCVTLRRVMQCNISPARICMEITQDFVKTWRELQEVWSVECWSPGTLGEMGVRSAPALRGIRSVLLPFWVPTLFFLPLCCHFPCVPWSSSGRWPSCVCMHPQILAQTTPVLRVWRVREAVGLLKWPHADLGMAGSFTCVLGGIAYTADHTQSPTG